MTITEPTDRAKEIVKAMENPENWKLPLKPFHTNSSVLAGEVNYAVGFYHGGSETKVVLMRYKTAFRSTTHPVDTTPGEHKVTWISSEGYYHYIGA